MAVGVSVTNAKSYELQQRTGAGEWQTAGIYTQARRIVLTVQEILNEQVAMKLV